MNESRFYIESLPLLATYFSGAKVTLDDIRTPISDSEEGGFALFERQLKARHYISLASSILRSIREIQEMHSTKTISSRTNSYGSVRGRLDTNRYISQKFQQKRYPPSYPIIISIQSPSTPENIFAKALIEVMLKKLLSITIPTNSAEFERAQKLRRALREHLKVSPWSEVTEQRNLFRLYMETKRRINRRQTGSEKGYSNLLLVYENIAYPINWTSEIYASPHFKDIFLSFPSDQFFLDRIFEVWCLKKVFDAFEGLGGKCVEINSLEYRKTKPIFSFSYKSKLINVFFQRQLPSSSSVWSYENGSKLHGIPDITVTSNDGNLIIDAKNRLITTNTRPEETYKILGYLENFKTLLCSSANWGLLIFTSTEEFSRSLYSSEGKRILLTGAQSHRGSSCNIIDTLVEYFEDWCDKI